MLHCAIIAGAKARPPKRAMRRGQTSAAPTKKNPAVKKREPSSVGSRKGWPIDDRFRNNMLKRGKLARHDGSGYVSPDDLRIGEDFIFLGKKVRIYGCDAFTRDYYEKTGNPQDMSRAEAPPVDNFGTYLYNSN